MQHFVQGMQQQAQHAIAAEDQQHKLELHKLMARSVTICLHSFGAFPLHITVRHGSVRYGTVRLSSGRFAFPLQFSTAIEWAGLFTHRYNCAASTAVTS